MTLRSAIRRSALPVARALKPAVLPVVYGLLRSRVASRLLPFEGPPILLLSYPRSGSTWVGTVLSTSARIAYLNEPITRQYHLKHRGRAALVDLDHDAAALTLYRTLADDSFRGAPPRDLAIAGNPRDFTYPHRLRKRILIKEVNPRATGFYCERYHPRTVLLLRHPAAIALSFCQLGWLSASDVQPHRTGAALSVWTGFGYEYGAVMHRAIETSKTFGTHDVVLFRDLARDPYNGFSRLFESLNLPLPGQYDTTIRKYCYSEKDLVSKDQVERVSQRMVDKWRTELTSQQIAELRRGYLQSPLSYYRDDADWC